MREIETLSPKDLQEVLKILTERKGDVTIFSGGSDLIVQVLEKKKELKCLLNISNLDELSYIREEGESIRIGALTTLREIEKSPIIQKYAPLLSEGAFLLGSPQLRNTATLGGNIVNASPVADSVPPLMVLDAMLTLKSVEGERRVPIREFFLGPGKSVIEQYELLVDISFKKLGESDVSFYERLGQRRLLSISKVGVAFKAALNGGRMSGVSVALGAVAPTVIMASNTASFLEGKDYSVKVAEEAALIAEGESKAITDIRSTKYYRNKMVGALLLRGLARVIVT